MTSKEDQQDRSDQTDNLPAVQDQLELDLVIPEVKYFPPDTDKATIKKDNTLYAHFELGVVSQLWNHATSFARAVKLLRELREVVKFRSDVMEIPYGAKGTNDKGNQLDPLD